MISCLRILFLKHTLTRKKKKKKKEVLYSCYFAQFNLGLLHVYNDYHRLTLPQEKMRKYEQNNICSYSHITCKQVCFSSYIYN